MPLVAICNKIIEYSFYALFFLVPLFFTNSTSELFELNKMWLTWGLTILVVTAWIIKSVSEKSFRIQRTPFDIPILVFLFSQLLSSFISIDRHISWWGYYSRFNGGFLSLLSYTVLYYAFVSNLLPVLTQKTQEKHKFSLPVRIGFFTGGVAIIFLSVLLAAPPMNQPDSAHPGIVYMAMGIALFLFLASFPRHFIERIILINLASALIVILWGLPSHFGNDPTCYLFRGTYDVTCWTEAFQPTVRIFSTLGQPAWLAAYLAALLPITIAYTLYKMKHTSPNSGQQVSKHYEKSSVKEPKMLWIISLFALIVLSYISLIFANTRGGFIAFWVGNAVFWLLLLMKQFSSLKTFLRTALIFNSIFLLLTFFLGAPEPRVRALTYPELSRRWQASQVAPHPQQETTPGTQTPPPSNDTQVASGITESGAIRKYVWKGAFDAWKSMPIFGYGVETFAFAYYRHRPAGHNLTSEWDYLYNKAHNEYLNYLATTGIVGLGTHLFFLAAVIVLSYLWFFSKKKAEETQSQQGKPAPFGNRSEGESFYLATAIIAAIISIVVSNFFGFSVVIISLFTFLLPAVMLFVANVLKEEKVIKIPFGAKGTYQESLNGIQWTVVTVTVLIACYMLLTLLRYWNADKAYALGSNLNKVGDYQQAYMKLKESVELRGSEPVFKDEFSSNNAVIGVALLQQKDATNAAGFIRDAIRLNDEIVTAYPNNLVFWKTRVRIFYMLSQVDPSYFPQALQSIQKAHELAPTDAKIAYNLGVIYGQSGDIKSAVRVLEEGKEMKPDYRDIYFALGLFYHELAKDGTETIMKPELQQKAVEALQYSLSHLNSKDEQIRDTLKSWNIQ